MPASLDALKSKARTPGGQKALRYAMVSVVSLTASQLTSFTLYAGFHWTARSAAVASAVTGGIPSYYLNRRWTWAKRGKSHVWREIVPFWVVAFLSLALSIVVADIAEHQAKELSDSRMVQGVIVNAAFIATFGVLWIGKFLLLNGLFVTRDEAVA